LNSLGEAVRTAVQKWVEENGWEEAPDILLERPAERGHGDYALPYCLQLSRVARRAPRELAEELAEYLSADRQVSRLTEAVEVAGPGFINFTLAQSAYRATVRDMLAGGEDIGRGESNNSGNILLEYVSVNPNGPLHVGHARYAAYGNSLDRILRFSGYEVSTELYINDYGRQMEMFARSVAARYAQLFGVDMDVPEDGYQGDYVWGIGERVREQSGDRWLEPLQREGLEDAGTETLQFIRSAARDLVLEEMREELEEFGVTFDNWFSETTLHERGEVQGVIQELEDSGQAYRSEDAVWLKTIPHGDDKDRVLIRSNERPTYFAADIAYHRDKLARGFDHLINIWGADHHGYIQRMKAVVEILAGGPERLEVIIGQLVNLLEEGELRQMSTRRGELVTLAELVDAIGVDAARFFLVMRSHDQPLDLDLDLARSESQENPVYYVQYAHARICSILRNLSEGEEERVPEGEDVFATDYEKDLIKKLEQFADVVQEAAERREPHGIAAYAQDLASDFHVFYKNCRVIGSAPDVSASRLALCVITGRVVARCLDLLGVRAPESM